MQNVGESERFLAAWVFMPAIQRGGRYPFINKQTTPTTKTQTKTTKQKQHYLGAFRQSNFIFCPDPGYSNPHFQAISQPLSLLKGRGKYSPSVPQCSCETVPLGRTVQISWSGEKSQDGTQLHDLLCRGSISLGGTGMLHTLYLCAFKPVFVE